jgi:ubiquinone biosynthesis UbiH/UbiF/VisC/COQ6 family hydroxylase
MQTSSFDVLIQGSGIVSRVTALLLATQNLRVALSASPSAGQPASDKAAPDIRAYAINAASRQMLQSLRVWPAANHPEAHAASPVQAMQVFDVAQQSHIAFKAPTDSALAWIANAQALSEQLEQAVHYQSRISLLNPTAMQCAQAEQRYALQILCEGRQSAQRQALGIGWTQHPYAHTALAARLRSAVPHAQTAKQWFAQGPQGLEIIGLLPQGTHDWALVWSMPQGLAAAIKALPAESFAQTLMQRCHAGNNTEQESLTLTSAVQSWPLFLGRASALCGPDLTAPASPTGSTPPSWALVGDAAHSIHPLAGQGLNLGLADAAALAQTLSQRESWRGPKAVGHLPLLRRYARARSLDHALWAQVTDQLFNAFAHQQAQVQQLRGWGLSVLNKSTSFKTLVGRMAAGV